MRAIEWYRYMENQREAYAKTVFTVAELANVSGLSRNALGVQLHQLCRRGVLQQFARGRYGLPGRVDAASLVREIDSGAYITGSFCLHYHGVVSQSISRITCFTNRRSNRSRVRHTPLGELVFVCVRAPVYAPPEHSVYSSAEQALFDYFFFSRRQGVDPRAVVTFSGLNNIDKKVLSSVAARYPKTVQRHVDELFVIE